MNILQWLIPSGALGTVIVWLTNKTIRNLRTVKEIHDTYKVMYEDLRNTMLEIQGDNKKLQRAVSRLERAVSKVNTCRHYPNCPVNIELQQVAELPSKTRGRGRQRSTHSHPAADTGSDEKEKDETDDTPEPYPSDKTKTISN